MSKQKIVILCLMSVLLTISFTVKAETHITIGEKQMTGATTVRLVIPSSYVVEIPATVFIPYGTESTPMTIGVSDMKLGTQQMVKIAVESSTGNLIQEDGNGRIPYRLSCEGREFSHVLYKEMGQIQLSIDVEQENWYKANVGRYSDAVTFHVSVEDQEVKP